MHTHQVIEELLAGSHAGTIGFGQVVAALVQEGVESYRVDYRLGNATYFLPSGETYTAPIDLPALPIADAFAVSEVQDAIRGAQSGRVKYPEFLARTMSAGCIGYTVWLAGRHVSYFGRRGEVHVEQFPGQPIPPRALTTATPPAGRQT